MLYKCGAYFNVIHRFDEKREWLRAAGHILPGLATKDNHRRCTMHRFVKYVTQGLACLAGTQRGRARFTKTLSRKRTAEQEGHDLPPSLSVVSDFSSDPETVSLRCLDSLSFILLIYKFISSLFLGYLVHNFPSKCLNTSFPYDCFLFLSILDSFLFYISCACSPTNKTHTTWTGHFACTFY
jgi:hypothetical protein